MQEQGGPLWLALSQNPKGEGDILTLAFEEHKAQIKFDTASPLFLFQLDIIHHQTTQQQS